MIIAEIDVIFVDFSKKKTEIVDLLYLLGKNLLILSNSTKITDVPLRWSIDSGLSLSPLLANEGDGAH